MTQEAEGQEQSSAPEKRGDSCRRRRVARIVPVVLGVYVVLAFVFDTWNPLEFGRGPTLTFDGDTMALTRTQIVPTLNTPIEQGKNVIWCATFAAGWKQLQQKVTKGPVNLTDAAEICARLNAAPDPAPTMPPEAFYANAGMIEKGIIQTIRQEMQAKSPKHSPPAFENAAAAGILFYSYIEAQVPFTLKYRNNPEPLEFTGSDGVKTAIQSFGFGKKDHKRYRLQEQPKILMVQWQEAPDAPGAPTKPESYAIDLCKDSQPYQIVVARVPRKESLLATLDALEQDIEAFEAQGQPEWMVGSVLHVPDMFWRLSHHYRELEGHPFENPAFQKQTVDIALQEIQFRLDRSGAHLSSEAFFATKSESQHEDTYQFNGPFLLYIKMRDGTKPFFVMWVDNAELLRRW